MLWSGLKPQCHTTKLPASTTISFAANEIIPTQALIIKNNRQHLPVFLASSAKSPLHSRPWQTGTNNRVLYIFGKRSISELNAVMKEQERVIPT